MRIFRSDLINTLPRALSQTLNEYSYHSQMCEVLTYNSSLNHSSSSSIITSSISVITVSLNKMDNKTDKIGA